MENIVPVYEIFFWFLFAIWVYLFLIYLLGFYLFLIKKSKNFKYDKKLLWIQFILFLTSTFLQIMFWVFYSLNKIENNEFSIPLLVFDSIFVISTLLFVLFFSNNFAIKFEEEYTNFLGIKILNTAIISVKQNISGDVIIEYVYKKEKNMKWTEKIKLFRKMKVTNFFFKNYKKFIDPEKNLAFFDIDKVIKK